MRQKLITLLSLGGLIAVILASYRIGQSLVSITSPTCQPPTEFNAERALDDLEYQVSLGPRTPGSDAHRKAIEWMTSELSGYGWNVDIQESEYQSYTVKNVIARMGDGADWILIGAHYDSRFRADSDPIPDNQSLPVPGANDGASGVAVLMELARTLRPRPEQTIWLVFFDFEDQGRIDSMNWIIGSTSFAESLSGRPNAVVILDMIGDASLNIYQEINSDPDLTASIWAKANELGYGDHFISEPRYRILDDHIPFLNNNIPAVDIIDFDYLYWHTINDTPDKTSAESLKIVGRTIWHWIMDE